MRFEELLFVLLIGLLAVAGPVLTFVLAVIAFSRSNRIKDLSRRIENLESRLQSPTDQGVSRSESPSPVSSADNLRTVERSSGPSQRPDGDVVVASVAKQAGELASPPPVIQTTGQNQSMDAMSAAGRSEAEQNLGWERFLGQKAFGWMAVVLFVLSGAFFLRYAFANNWIGPIGRVIIGQVTGLGLVAVGVYYYRRGLVRFSGMVTAAGFITLYLATYCAYGFYRLLPQPHVGLFLTVIVIESMVAAVLYRSLPVAVATVIGGLATPVLLASDYDAYQSFFSYLAVLNMVVAGASLFRKWPLIASIAFVGTQSLFWMWWEGNYHPEKFAWAFGFQSFLFMLYWSHSVVKAFRNETSLDYEELARFALNGVAGFAGFHRLLQFEYSQWLGVGAIAMSCVYAATAYILLVRRLLDQRLLLMSLALSLGFLSWALPLQANSGWQELSHWIAMGWAIIGVSLYRFGLRIGSPGLRAMAGVLGVAAVCRWMVNDTPLYIRQPFIPIFNEIGFPATFAALCILVAVVSAYSFWSRLKSIEQFLLSLAGTIGVVMLWIVLSFECYGFFVSRSLLGGELVEWRWRGQLALTVLWALYATALLAAGFRLDRSRLRWMGIALYGVTVIKLFLVDMDTVEQIYRILGFFILSIVLALVARAYQRFK